MCATTAQQSCSLPRGVSAVWWVLGMPPRWKTFALQLVEWTGAVVLARILCGCVVSAWSQTVAPLVLWQGDAQTASVHACAGHCGKGGAGARGRGPGQHLQGAPNAAAVLRHAHVPAVHELAAGAQHVQLDSSLARAPGPNAGLQACGLTRCPPCCAQALVQDAVLKWKRVPGTHAEERGAPSAVHSQEEEEVVRPKREQEEVRLLATTMRMSSSVPAGRGGQPAE